MASLPNLIACTLVRASLSWALWGSMIVFATLARRLAAWFIRWLMSPQYANTFPDMSHMAALLPC
jgi:hypothetical protein